MTAFLRAYGVHIAIALAILGGLWWVDHRGYSRGQADAEAARLERLEQTRELVKAIDVKLDQRLSHIETNLAGQLAAIDTEERTIVTPTITREILSDPRLSSPACAVSDSLLRELNRARGHSVGVDAPAVGAK